MIESLYPRELKLGYSTKKLLTPKGYYAALFAVVGTYFFIDKQEKIGLFFLGVGILPLAGSLYKIISKPLVLTLNSNGIYFHKSGQLVSWKTIGNIEVVTAADDEIPMLISIDWIDMEVYEKLLPKLNETEKQIEESFLENYLKKWPKQTENETEHNNDFTLEDADEQMLADIENDDTLEEDNYVKSENISIEQLDVKKEELQELINYYMAKSRKNV